MRTLLLVLITIAVAIGTNGQNVMTPSDQVYQYDPAAAVGSPANPAVPGTGVISKWVRDARTTYSKNRINWDQSRYKCYYINGMAFRLQFPKNYNPNSTTKYPMVMFMHGLCEGQPGLNANACPISNCQGIINRENQDQLFWGGFTFDDHIVNDRWNGFLFFPQQRCELVTGWDNTMFEPINQVLDTLAKYNNFDPQRLTVMGLSAGAAGNINYAARYPKRVAAIVSSDPAFGFTDANATFQIPLWIANGGQDGNPAPPQVRRYIESVRDLGGDTYQTYNATGGHSSWTGMWGLNNVNGKLITIDYWNRAHKAQPVVYFQKTRFCASETIAAKMGLTPGFNAYEWQKNVGAGFTTISGANGNEYTATVPGFYRARYRATAAADWSDWSQTPIEIALKNCASDTVFVEHFDFYGSAPGYLYAGPAWGYRNYNDFRQSGLFVTGSSLFTQDAKGQQGGRFMFNHTYPHSTTGDVPQTTPYAVGDIVWRYYDGVSVIPNRDYIFSFYVGSITSQSPLVQLVPKINGVALTPTNVGPTAGTAGNSSWTKYTYIWNSGGNYVAYLEIANNTIPSTAPAASNGNDFALDEISFTTLLSPGGIGSAGMALWAKSESLTSTPGSGLATWANAGGTKDLVQTTHVNKPQVSLTSADMINFNPVAAFSTSDNADFMTAKSGFVSATTAATSAHIYVVARSNSATQPSSLVEENLSPVGGTNKMEVFLPNSLGNVTWAAGSLVNNAVSAPFNSSDVNKPLLWSFSKDDANTGSGNKQDLRKNGKVLAFNNNTGSFSGFAGDLRFGRFNGRVAEAIYYLGTNIDATEQSKIESYLALKYGITLTEGGATNYIASNGTVVWNGNSTYQNNVFGIGKDDASGLNQFVSNSMNTGSGDGAGQAGAGNLVMRRTSALNNFQYLVIGSDNTSLAEQFTDLPSFAIGAKRVGREWKVNNTGTVGAVNISFDITGLTVSGGNTVGNYSLLIDNDGDGDFTTGSQTAINASSIDGAIIRFNNVTLNNNVVFTITTLAPTSGALPATWVSFSVNFNESNVFLNWKTTDETNVSNYVVEHSTNAIDYEVIGSVKASNTTGLNEYNFNHEGLNSGIHYYRIRRVDLDEKAGYSDVRLVRIDGSNNHSSAIKIASNPVIGKNMLVYITTPQSVSAIIEIIDAEGKRVWSQNNNLTSGTSNLNISLGSIANGVYMLRVQMNAKVVTEKFIKQ